MTTHEAREILLLAQPGREDGSDPRVAEALSLAGRDPALREWLERQRALQAAARRGLRDIPVPSGLRDKILASRNLVRPVAWWRHPVLWSAAALLMALLGAGLWLSDSPDKNDLDTFRGRMVRAVLRQYTMDITTNDMSQVRAFLSSKNAPADYTLPEKLGRLPVSGGGVLSWQGQKVSMVCFDSLRQGTLFLFVVDATSVGGSPGVSPEFQQVNKLGTVIWNANGRIYVLAGTGGQAALRQYF